MAKHRSDADPTKIQLIVTGDLEAYLPEVLEALFPEAKFLPAERAHAFTTAKLTELPRLTDKQSAHALKGYELLSRMLAAVDPGATGEPADYAIAIDDVEVDNRDNEEAIVAHVRELVGFLIELGPHDRRGNPLVSTRPDEPDVGKGKHLVRPLKNAERRRDALRERCSFHLLAPMIEAPFFGDFAAVRRGCPNQSPKAPCFDPKTCDFESFETTDSDFLAKPDDWRAPGALFAASWTRPNRRFHPKHYLEFLFDPNGQQRKPYIEKGHGASILRQLDWKVLLNPFKCTDSPDEAVVGRHARFLRSLIDDIADICGVQLPAGAAGELHPLTKRRVGGLLRNVSR